MKIAVSRITPSPKEMRFSESIEELSRIYDSGQGGDFCFPPFLDVSLTYYRSGQEIFFQGRLGGTVEGRCSRCLKGYRFPIEKEFEFVLTPEPEPNKSRQLGGDEMALSFYAVDEIDLSPFIREQVFLALPLRPLCEDRCRGLCAGCGADLNDEPCLCGARQDDPRMAIFRTLKLDR